MKIMKEVEVPEDVMESVEDALEAEGIHVSTKTYSFGMPISLTIEGTRFMNPKSARELAALLLVAADIFEEGP